MSWSRDSESAQLVGRVIDPSVREDGEPEPDVQLAPSHGRLEPSAAAIPASADAVPASPAGEQTLADTRSSPVDAAPPEPISTTLPQREDRPIERTSTASPAEPSSDNRVSGAPAPWSEEFGVSSRDRELDLVGTEPVRVSAPAAPSLRPEHRLSPTWTAIFATLLGLCAVATFIAIAVHLDRKQPRVSEVQKKPEAPQPSQSAPPPVVDRRPPRTKLPGPWRIRDAEKDPAMHVIEGKVGLDPLVKSVEKSGVPLKQFYRVIAAFSKVRPLTNCSKSDRYIVLLDRATKRIKAFEYLTNPEEVFQAKEGEDGFLAAQKLDLQVKQARVSSAFVVGDDGLEAAVLAGGLEKTLLGTMREALSGHAALEELERGTRVRVIAQEITVLGDFARYAGIEAMEIDYPGADRKRERIYYFNGPDSHGYFDSAGRAPYSGGWRKPIPSAPITSKFNPKRFHPILKRIMPHEGIDFGAPTGTPVGASSFGTVTFVGFAGPTGNFVRISHSGDVETGYAHLSRFAEGLKVGDKVKRMQIIGYVGSTGRSTGPHLHFSAKRAGKFFDPETLNLDGLRTLAANERPQFEQAKAEYDKLLETISLPEPPAMKDQPPSAPSSAAIAEGEELEGPAAAPTAAASTPATNAQSGSTSGNNAVYLTDDELKKSQNATDDGEVAE